MADIIIGRVESKIFQCPVVGLDSWSWVRLRLSVYRLLWLLPALVAIRPQMKCAVPLPLRPLQYLCNLGHSWEPQLNRGKLFHRGCCLRHCLLNVSV